jgi:hypothetical protein
MAEKQLFDDWPERYDRWFETPVGKAVLKSERQGERRETGAFVAARWLKP